ncbi:MAG: CNNM domain-containing protein [candidate division WOR-3 bacterium]
MVILLLVIFFSMSISLLCSIFESCLLSISRAAIGEMSIKRPKPAFILSTFKDNIQKPIAVILIVNTFAHTIGASLAGAQFNKVFGGKWILIFSILYSFAMIQWTEILPKTLGVKYNKKIALLIVYPLELTIRIFSPMVWFIELLNRPFVGKSTETSKLKTIDELSALANYAYITKTITKDQEQIISRTIDVSKKKVQDIMIPAKDMKVLRSSMSLSEALIEAHIHNHTRYPLIDDSTEAFKVIGYVNFKDIISALKINPHDPSVVGIKRPIMKFSPIESYGEAFRKMTASRQHIAIVESQEGKVLGLVTLEDIIEEIVGEIEDEYDVMPSYLYKITENRYNIGGGVKIEEINKLLNMNLPEPEKALGDWILSYFGVEPKASMRLQHKEANFIIRKIRRNRIIEVILEKK